MSRDVKRNAAGDRVVYSESHRYENEAAQARPVPELPPNQQTLRVEISRKGRGGKTVTLVSGFVSQPETLSALLKRLKTQCGSGGTLKSSDRGLELEIQGDHRQKVAQFLSAQGYKVKTIG